MARVTGLALGFVLCAAAIGASPVSAMAGSIVGTVTAENGGAPIQGVEVCPRREPYTVETDCTTTDGAGHYSLNALPEGSYKLNFSANRANLKYVSEFFDNKQYSWEADLVLVGASGGVTVDAQLAEGGSIAGTVTDEGSGNPIAGISACAIDSEGIPARCSQSDTGGHYQLNGLRTGKYAVEFEGGNRVNYLTEFYKDAEHWAGSEKIEVEAPNPVTGIDAQLAPGAQILGYVGEVGTGAPLARIMVCAEAQLEVGEYGDCDWTNSSGEYALRSLRAGTYLVGFGIEYLPFSGRHTAQWWQGASSEADATPIAIAPPETREGIDALIANPNPVPQHEVVSAPAPAARRGKALAARLAKVKRGRALLKLRCRGGPCKGVVKLLVGRKLIGKAGFSIAAGRAKVIRVKLNRRGKRKLARRHRLKAKLRGSRVKPGTVVLKRPSRRARPAS